MGTTAFPDDWQKAVAHDNVARIANSNFFITPKVAYMKPVTVGSGIYRQYGFHNDKVRK